jgi:hypothetical protein
MHLGTSKGSWSGNEMSPSVWGEASHCMPNLFHDRGGHATPSPWLEGRCTTDIRYTHNEHRTDQRIGYQLEPETQTLIAPCSPWEALPPTTGPLMKKWNRTLHHWQRSCRWLRDRHDNHGGYAENLGAAQNAPSHIATCNGVCGGKPFGTMGPPRLVIEHQKIKHCRDHQTR